MARGRGLDGDGALADERDWHRVGAGAVARDAAGGVGGDDEEQRPDFLGRLMLRTYSRLVGVKRVRR